MKIKRFLGVWLICSFLFLSLAGCGNKEALSAGDPVTLTFWHVYGEQADSPMAELIQEFNETEGLQKGVIIDVTRVSNASEIGEQVLESMEGKTGAPAMPDLFCCYPGSASSLDPDKMLNWDDVFSEEELAEYVPEFVEEGRLKNRLVVFPLSTSTRLLFVNGTVYDRFSKDTGHTYEDLETWEGFRQVAGDYYAYSDGQPFCAFDYIAQNVDMIVREEGLELPVENDWYQTDNEALHQTWLTFADEIIQGHIIISDLYANTQMMTGEVPAGIGSSAAILYFNDQVTYADGRTEDMNLKVFPMPEPEGSSIKALAPQTGCGIGAGNLEGKEKEAAAVFMKWLTEKDRNLTFAAETGYMPVRKDSFDAISDYTFDDRGYEEVYGALKKVQEERELIALPAFSGYISKTNYFYNNLREAQADLHERYLAGADPDTLKEETWEMFCQAGDYTP